MISVSTILLVILILLLLGALPTWGHSRNWGYGPSGGLGLLGDRGRRHYGRLRARGPAARQREHAGRERLDAHGHRGGPGDGDRDAAARADHRPERQGAPRVNAQRGAKADCA